MLVWLLLVCFGLSFRCFVVCLSGVGLIWFFQFVCALFCSLVFGWLDCVALPYCLLAGGVVVWSGSLIVLRVFALDLLGLLLGCVS